MNYVKQIAEGFDNGGNEFTHSDEEINNIIFKLKNNKSACENGIVAKLLKEWGK